MCHQLGSEADCLCEVDLLFFSSKKRVRGPKVIIGEYDSMERKVRVRVRVRGEGGRKKEKCHLSRKVLVSLNNRNEKNI